VLGAQPALGKLLHVDDARAGSEAVVVIGYGLWRRQFRGDPAVVGQRLRLYGQQVTIVGVAPPGFAFPDGAEVWRPLRATAAQVNRGAFSLVARLRPEATFAQAAQESSILLERLRSIAPVGAQRDLHAVAVPLKEAIVGDVRPVIRLFVAAAVLLFLVGSINVTNLLLVRGTARGREMAVRTALGATRARLVGQLVAEGASLAVTGGVLGAFVAYWLQRILIATAPVGLPRLDQVGFNARTIALAAAGSMLAAAVAGVAPAFITVRHALVERLRGNWTDGARVRGRQVGRQILIASQLAFALLVTVAAALLVRSLLQLQAVDLGFSSDRLTVVSVPLVGPAYEGIERRRQFFDELVSRMEAMPGISAATPVLMGPFTGIDGWDATFLVDGQGREEASANPGLHMETVLPNYFRTMGIRIQRGREFTDGDREGAQPVVIVSESLARRAWPRSAALGKRLKRGTVESSDPWMTVIGIVGDLHYRDLKASPPAIYLPLRQTPFPPRALIVRANVQDAPVLSMATQIVKGIDPGEPVTEASSIAALLAVELAGPRFHMFALGLFAFVVVLLAGVGVFGVMAAFVAQRSRELGVRMALGAKPTDLRRLVLSKVSWPAMVGLTAGSCMVLAATRPLRPLLFQVSVIDAEAFAAGWLILALAALLASLIPLRRAGRVDPVHLLRAE
jgi:predicted permease